MRYLILALKETRQILKHVGRFQVTPFNYDSIWPHLYNAYMHQIKMGIYSDMSAKDVFQRKPSNSNCTILIVIYYKTF
jgi:hypothetical protein